MSWRVRQLRPRKLGVSESWPRIGEELRVGELEMEFNFVFFKRLYQPSFKFKFKSLNISASKFETIQHLMQRGYKIPVWIE